MSTPVHEVYALRYASATMPKCSRFHRYAARFDDGDDMLQMDFYFWLIRSEGRIVLVDTGFSPDQTSFPGYEVDTHPLELLARLGVAAEDVDHVVLSHMHFDHVGNVGLFPRARFTMARAELDFWTGPLAGKPDIGLGGLPHEIAAVQQLADDGRLDLVDDVTELLSGLTVQPFRGHTPGLLLTHVRTESGTVVLASDAAHFYYEIENDHPFWLFIDLEGMYAGYEMLRAANRQGLRVVAGHDPLDMTRFTVVAENCIDLTKPIQGAQP